MTCYLFTTCNRTLTPAVHALKIVHWRLALTFVIISSSYAPDFLTELSARNTVFRLVLWNGLQGPALLSRDIYQRRRHHRIVYMSIALTLRCYQDRIGQADIWRCLPAACR